MSTHNIQLHDKIRKFPCIFVLLSYRKNFVGTQKLIQISYGITKTHLSNFDPLKPHFYKINLGFTGVYIVFLILLKTQIVGTGIHCFSYSTETQIVGTR